MLKKKNLVIISSHEEYQIKNQGTHTILSAGKNLEQLLTGMKTDIANLGNTDLTK